MPDRSAAARAAWNRPRFVPASPTGHYESWFLRGNHPDRPLAFWIRYTLFSPRERPGDALGELWAIWFDGEANRIVAVKEEYPLAQCAFGADGTIARVGDARLTDDRLQGAARSPAHALAWDLRCAGGDAPLLLLRASRYERGFPKAKALVARPHAAFDGVITVDGEPHPIERWIGSQNHNWGSRHTDRYAWGQVAGFDDAPDAFLECATAQLRMGPFWTPPMTLVVLRLGDETLALNALGRALRARGSVRTLEWRFASAEGDVAIDGRISAPPDRFVGLTYGNPPGGAKICLNSKLARCEVTVRRAGRPPRTLVTAHRAAFEILDDATRAGIPVVV